MASFSEDELQAARSKVRELDFSAHLAADPVANEWTQLGLWTVGRPLRQERIETVLSRQCLIIPVDAFADLFSDLESVGNVLDGLGEPAQWMLGGEPPRYRYDPFHTFPIGRHDVVAEPIVYRDPRTSHDGFCINPDLTLFLKLEETSFGSGVWKDPKHGNDVLRHLAAEKGEVEKVEIRTSYLLQYLRARRQSLLFGHYQDCALYEPTREEVDEFGEEGEALHGSPSAGGKVLLQNRGLEKSIALDERFLFRRMHLWLIVNPPDIDVDDPWATLPPFDPTAFTFPTYRGQVAPARWKHFAGSDTADFKGVFADFMTPVYFRQEVLQKYQGTTGFEVEDDGSVVCGHYWGLQRSTARLGNELVMTAIGDFAQGVPFEQWSHWKHHVVEVPTDEEVERMRAETTIPDAVNSVIDALAHLNAFTLTRASSRGIHDPSDIWQGSADSLAARQLKWVYPMGAGDAEFLMRATLGSTLVVDGIVPSGIRRVLSSFANGLERQNPLSRKSATLGSRNLLQRLVLVCLIADRMAPGAAELRRFVRKAETVDPSKDTVDIELELAHLYADARQRMKALAFLYDLRVHGGVAHPPSLEKVGAAASSLGLPRKGWDRRHYLSLLDEVARGILQVAETIE